MRFAAVVRAAFAVVAALVVDVHRGHGLVPLFSPSSPVQSAVALSALVARPSLPGNAGQCYARSQLVQLIITSFAGPTLVQKLASTVAQQRSKDNICSLCSEC